MPISSRPPASWLYRSFTRSNTWPGPRRTARNDGARRNTSSSRLRSASTWASSVRWASASRRRAVTSRETESWLSPPAPSGSGTAVVSMFRRVPRSPMMSNSIDPRLAAADPLVERAVGVAVLRRDDVVDAPAEHAGLAVRLQHGEAGRVHLVQRAVRADELDALRGGLDDRPVAGLARPLGVLGPLPLGDVAGDLRRPDDAALVVADRGDRQRDVEPAAVLGHADRLEVLDPLAAAEPLQDRALLVVPLRRDDQGDRPADGLLGRVAEEPLGPGVPRADDAVERLADDRVVGRLDDGRQPRLGLLRPLALGHVAEDQDRPDRGPGLVPHGGGAVVDRPLGPVPGDEDRVVRQARRSSPPARRGGRGSRPAGGSAR